MRTNSIRAARWALLPAAVIVLTGIVAATQAGSGPRAQVIALPGKWVPFSAKRVATRAGYAPRLGSFYRSADGSSATVIEDPSKGRIVTIHNRHTRKTYVRFGDDEGWVEHELVPSQDRPAEREMRFVPGRVRRVPESVAGGAVYEIPKRDGSLVKLAANLNGFIVYTRESDGSIVEFTDIQLGEPPKERFLPDAGVQPTPRGLGDFFSSERIRNMQADHHFRDEEP